MKTITKVLLSGFTALALTACGGSSTGDSTKDDAINKIANYAQNGGEAPTLQDYANAGVTGISNVDEINAFILTLTKEDVDTTEEIQAIANQLGVVIEGNIPPIALAEASKTTIVEGEVTNLYGHLNSSDPDGEIVAWSWIENGVPFANVPSFTKDDFSVGKHLITLVVTDNDGATSFDNIEITVTAAPVATPPVETEAQCLQNAGGYVAIEVGGRTWLDRNLGASQVATSLTDTAAYGNLYQWGRAAEGHESRTSQLSKDVLGSGSGPNHADTILPDVNQDWYGLFINEGSNGTNLDWVRQTVDTDGSQRAALWGTAASATNVNQVCPCGYVVPSQAELAAVDPNELKLTYSGYRLYDSGTIVELGFSGVYWTNDTFGNNSGYQHLLNGGAWVSSATIRAYGFAVRCIKPVQ